MSTARITELSASSSKDFEDAIANGLKRANETLENIEGAWIQDFKVTCKDGKIDKYRVNMKVTFVLR
jgi:flavin-binding protein dodecin